MPAGSTFSVDLQTHPMAQQFMRLGPDPLPTVLHLPTSGHGTWYIPLPGGLHSISAENIVWDGNAYNFGIKLRLFGRFNASLAVSGEVDPDGGIQGAPETSSTGFSPFQAFTGTRAGAEN